MTEQAPEQGSIVQGQAGRQTDRLWLRLWLARLLKVMAWIMLLGFAYWCLAGLGSDEQTKLERYQVDVSSLPEGAYMELSVGTLPLIILHRSAAQLATLTDDFLNDPSSWQNSDPAGLHSSHRGKVGEWIVIEALGTELNCPVEVKPAGGEFQGRPWPGGLADKCRDQRYDWAGRVFENQGARRNLRVMSYSVVSGPSLSIRLP